MRKFYKIVLHGSGLDQVMRVPCVNVGDPDRGTGPFKLQRAGGGLCRSERSRGTSGLCDEKPCSVHPDRLTY